MEYRSTEKGFPILEKSAVTLGKFDGVHLGHRELLRNIKKKKEEDPALTTVLLAFTSQNPTIFTQQERMRLLEGIGVDLLIECPLDMRLRRMPAEEFVQEILVERLHAKHLAVGVDFGFGYGRSGNYELLSRMSGSCGFTVDRVESRMDGDRKISSTYIRSELVKGNMEKVESLLGSPFYLDSRVVHGRGMGHRMLLPTVNLVPVKEKLMPPNGVYFTTTIFEDRQYTGITNVGYKPTVGEVFLGVETYLFDCDEDLYEKDCRVIFHHFSRPEQKFPSFEALKERLYKDAEEGREYFTHVRI